MLFFILVKVMNKKELRLKYKQMRNQLSAEEIDIKSQAIANQLLTLDIWQYENYHIFLPIETQKEVNTEYILHILQGKDKNIIISKSNFEDYSMENYLLTDNTRLKINQWGIPEPENGILIDPKTIDVVFTPLLAYDQLGNRIGYGKGFYDRLLTIVEPKKIIGLSFFKPEKTNFNINKNDIKLTNCVLHDKTYDFI